MISEAYESKLALRKIHTGMQKYCETKIESKSNVRAEAGVLHLS